MIFPGLMALPDWETVGRVLLLLDYNTRLVVLSTSLLGLACGLIGCLLLLRKRSLMGDALSHATLPGIAIGFLVLVSLGGSGKFLPALLLGAAVTGGLGCFTVLLVRQLTRIKDDTAMGIVLSVFFGLGVVLLSLIQSMPGGSAAGLESFIYGKTASLILTDFYLLVALSIAAVLASLLLYKEFRLLCFDEVFAASQGWPVRFLDVLMLTFVTVVTVAGLQAVGLILIIAFLIIPAAAARFWTERFSLLLVLGGVIGAASGWIGASLSALLPRLPAGAVIVLVATALFLLSMLVGTSRGVLHQWARHHNLRRKMERQHLLRAAYEILETSLPSGRGGAPPEQRVVEFSEVLQKRSWTAAELRRILRRVGREGLVVISGEGKKIRLTASGLLHAARVTKNHRLWEIYLIRYADIAPSHVDRDADAVEHILGEEMVDELEAALQDQADRAQLPVAVSSPHPLEPTDQKGDRS